MLLRILSDASECSEKWQTNNTISCLMMIDMLQ